MKANSDKCYLLISSTSQSKLKTANVTIKSSPCEKLLGVEIDNKLSLNIQVEDVCKRATRKIHALVRIAPNMTVSKILILMNAFFISKFSYRPFVWMCQNRTHNKKINRLHELCLKIIYNDKLPSFQNLLDLQPLFIEMYKVSKHIKPKIFADIFSSDSRANCDLRYQSEFSRPLIKTVFNGTETISYLGLRIWDVVPLDMN